MSQRNQPIISGIEGTVTVHSDVDATTSAVLQNNWTATIAPAITDDSGAGYAVGSEWIDVTADKSYKLVDASVGAAVWIETTGGGGAFLPLAGGTMTGVIVVEDDTYIEFGSANATWQFEKNSATGYLEITNTDEGFVTTLFDQEALWSAKLYVEERIVFTNGGYGANISGQIIPPVSVANNIYLLPDASGTIALTSDIINPSLINTAVTTTFVTPNETINCTSGTFAVNLPSANPIQGTTFTLVNSGTGVITLTPDAGDFINGNTTITLTQYVSRTVQSDGDNWIII